GASRWAAWRPSWTGGNWPPSTSWRRPAWSGAVSSRCWWTRSASSWPACWGGGDRCASRADPNLCGNRILVPDFKPFPGSRRMDGPVHRRLAMTVPDVPNAGGEAPLTLNEIGELLRRRREELGLSLRDAQTATKIRWRYLEALERGDDSVIPGYVYAKGFLRTYAEYLGLDGWALVEAYKQVREGPQAAVQRPDRGRSRRVREGAAPAAREGPVQSPVRVGAAPLTLPARRPPAGRR